VQIARHPFDGPIDSEIAGSLRSAFPFGTSVCSVVGQRSPVFALPVIPYESEGIERNGMGSHHRIPDAIRRGVSRRSAPLAARVGREPRSRLLGDGRPCQGSPLEPHGEDLPCGSVGAHLQHCEPHSPISHGLHLHESSR